MSVRRVENTRWTPLSFSRRVGTESYWLMRCDCGAEKIVCLRNYRTGKSLSCGCYRKEVLCAQRGLPRLPVGESARNQLLLIYKRGAKKRGLDFSLSRDEFLSLTSDDCHYCGSPPTNVLDRGKYTGGRGNGALIYNGIDRVDSAIGYRPSNCVTCCMPCNHAKMRMSYGAFIAWLDRLVAFRSSNTSKQQVA